MTGLVRYGCVLVMLAAFLLACGCTTSPTVPATVSVAVAQPCDAPVPDRPVFPGEALTGDEDIFTIGKTLWADHYARESYEVKLRAALEGCTARTPPGGSGLSLRN